MIKLAACILLLTLTASGAVHTGSISAQTAVIASDMRPCGDLGRLYIPRHSINVALYEGLFDAQGVVDKEDSALYRQEYRNTYIADHSYQGFSGIRDTAEGDSAYIKQADGSVEIYNCFLACDGYNSGSGIYLADGRSTTSVDCDFFCYTSKEGSWKDVRIAFFQRESSKRKEDGFTDIRFDTKPCGDVGRLYIPSRGVDVAVNFRDYFSYSFDTMQNVVDDTDSALMTNYRGGYPYIADHDYQGFVGIRDCQIGDMAYIRRPDGSIDMYECFLSCDGTNSETDLCAYDGRNASSIPCDFYAYTCCEGSWRNIRMAYFRKI